LVYHYKDVDDINILSKIWAIQAHLWTKFWF